MTVLKWLVSLLIVITGGIHFYLAALFGGGFYTWAFVVAGLGFLLGLVLILYNYKPIFTYSLGIVFTLGQIVWYWIVDGITLSMISSLPLTHLVDKGAQVLLVILLTYLLVIELKK